MPAEWHGWLHATTDSCPENVRGLDAQPGISPLECIGRACKTSVARRGTCGSSLSDWSSRIADPERNLLQTKRFRPPLPQTTFVQPIYASHVVGNPTGTPARHQPKGSWFKGPEKRNWLKFQAWTPPKA